MPWKESSVMEKRLQFVARGWAGEAMAELCREFGISHKTRYKIFRYQQWGCKGSPTAATGPIARPINFPFRWRTTS
jgi:hypothetical protein